MAQSSSPLAQADTRGQIRSLADDLERLGAVSHAVPSPLGGVERFTRAFGNADSQTEPRCGAGSFWALVAVEVLAEGESAGSGAVVVSEIDGLTRFVHNDGILAFVEGFAGDGNR
jgi:hypothetical protein